uniref:RNA-binding protein CP31B, chloroplastic n=1 Tax=Erigeron canadensis TaxID=72917 RepID=UPI001CB9B31A|nr:RNA-binding protein CP31B, chloroplastic [Erigeron canadensis]XP_043632324.1 RNA-binding protein CP31B, chloroplastic [Erigeron canadensis]XP_043632332.1 RNA-binding protein CP31B, chloroplastic [Erigeron canadensis]XP_043632341.1 RNA-binding protein CP31B, chloroplastic [Erigeron canadensis]
MATYCFSTSTSTSTSTSFPLSISNKSKINPTNPLISTLHFPSSAKNHPAIKNNKSKKIFTVSALIENEQQQEQQQYSSGNGFSLQEEDIDLRNSYKPFELYVCNLPRSCGITELLNKFQTYGTVQSVEVPRIPETGMSRGCGYVTMSSLDEAKAAIAALDGTDVDGRDMRVRFSADMNSKWGSTVTSSRPQKNLVFESPYKVYAGNLAWSVKPEDLRNHFSQFGNVVSTTVLHDRKGGKNRVYGFLSFSTSEELEAAMSLDGTQFYGRTIKLREVVKWPEPEP